jgi:DMSO/TMAO reductase YedYZ molybdopterin-dependent catalytic subunit
MADVEGTLTPTDRFFVRSHHSQPRLSLKTWRLRVEGAVASPLELSFPDLVETSTRSLEGLLECAGNRTGLVSNGLWEGVPLSDLIRQAQPKEGAKRVLLQGADKGSLMPDMPESPYSRILPLEKCLAPETLVAFKLNGQFLPRRNGFPARAFIPGWYGMDSVKWLTRVRILDAFDWPPAYYSSGMDLLYQKYVKFGTQEQITGRVSEIQVNSGFSFPPPGANLAPGRYPVRGFAWAGPHRVGAVEVSSDRGRSWRPARLEGESRPFTWVRWSYDWAAPKGEHLLMARAQDHRGRRQPIRRDTNRTDGYELNWYPSVQCNVL